MCRTSFFGSSTTTFLSGINCCTWINADKPVLTWTSRGPFRQSITPEKLLKIIASRQMLPPWVHNTPPYRATNQLNDLPRKTTIIAPYKMPRFAALRPAPFISLNYVWINPERGLQKLTRPDRHPVFARFSHRKNCVYLSSNHFLPGRTNSCRFPAIQGTSEKDVTSRSAIRNQPPAGGEHVLLFLPTKKK